MDYWWLADFIRNFPQKKTRTIIRVLMQFIILCVVWWVLETTKEWATSTDSVFWGMAENWVYVLLCFYWLSWLTDAAIDTENAKDDALDSKPKVLDLLTKHFGKWKEFKVQDILANEKILAELSEIFKNCNWNKSKILKRLKYNLRRLTNDWKLKKIDDSTYSIISNPEK